MPRKGKGPQSSVIPDQNMPSPGYGQGQELAALQNVAPIQPPAPIPTGTPTAPAPTPQKQPLDPFQLAQQYVNPTGLPPNAPTTRPDIPVTHGMSIGPGAGPEILHRARPHQPAADILDLLADLSGDPELSIRAARIRGDR